VIRAGIVEVHRELDEPHAHHLRVKLEVALRIGRNGRDVMDAFHRLG
jgi:hypothetical protein